MNMQVSKNKIDHDRVNWVSGTILVLGAVLLSLVLGYPLFLMGLEGALLKYASLVAGCSVSFAVWFCYIWKRS